MVIVKILLTAYILGIPLCLACIVLHRYILAISIYNDVVDYDAYLKTNAKSSDPLVNGILPLGFKFSILSKSMFTPGILANAACISAIPGFREAYIVGEFKNLRKIIEREEEKLVKFLIDIRIGRIKEQN